MNTTITDLQMYLKSTKRYFGNADGKPGPMTRAGIMIALTDGPDTLLTDNDFILSAGRLGLTAPHIKAITAVESSGAGFLANRPVLLFEPHRFSKATKGKFDVSNPDVSYPSWDKSKYPKTQDARYEQMVKAICLDVDAGFASASYGRFQILGENFAACGFTSPLAFAVAQAYDEAKQLESFEKFITTRNLVNPLRRKDWAAFAKGYNGSSYAQNKYDEKLKAAYEKAGGL